MKENKAMTQEIRNMSILYQKTPKEFYHHIKFQKSIMKKRCSIKKTVIKNFATFTGKHLCWSLFLIEMLLLKIVKKRLQHRPFLDNALKFLSTAILNGCF